MKVSVNYEYPEHTHALNGLQRAPVRAGKNNLDYVKIIDI